MCVRRGGEGGGGKAAMSSWKSKHKTFSLKQEALGLKPHVCSDPATTFNIHSRWDMHPRNIDLPKAPRKLQLSMWKKISPGRPRVRRSRDLDARQAHSAVINGVL